MTSRRRHRSPAPRHLPLCPGHVAQNARRLDIEVTGHPGRSERAGAREHRRRGTGRRVASPTRCRSERRRSRPPCRWRSDPAGWTVILERRLHRLSISGQPFVGRPHTHAAASPRSRPTSARPNAIDQQRAHLRCGLGVTMKLHSGPPLGLNGTCGNAHSFQGVQRH